MGDWSTVEAGRRDAGTAAGYGLAAATSPVDLVTRARPTATPTTPSPTAATTAQTPQAVTARPALSASSPGGPIAASGGQRRNRIIWPSPPVDRHTAGRR